MMKLLWRRECENISLGVSFGISSCVHGMVACNSAFNALALREREAHDTDALWSPDGLGPKFVERCRVSDL